jgi:hypothetical protein
MSGRRAGVAVFVALIGGSSVGYVGLRWQRRGARLAAGVAPDPSVERYQVPLGDAPVKGDERAKVTIVEYSDFQCPFCARVEPTIDRIVKTYGKDVRVVWKISPLPFHQNALPAAALAAAAAKEGRFWPVHDKRFASQAALDRASLEKYAQEIGLDVTRFKHDLDAGRFKASVSATSSTPPGSLRAGSARRPFSSMVTSCPAPIRSTASRASSTASWPRRRASTAPSWLRASERLRR